MFALVAYADKQTDRLPPFVAVHHEMTFADEMFGIKRHLEQSQGPIKRLNRIEFQIP